MCVLRYNVERGSKTHTFGRKTYSQITYKMRFKHIKTFLTDLMRLLFPSLRVHFFLPNMFWGDTSIWCSISQDILLYPQYFFYIFRPDMKFITDIGQRNLCILCTSEIFWFPVDPFRRDFLFRFLFELFCVEWYFMFRSDLTVDDWIFNFCISKCRQGRDISINSPQDYLLNMLCSGRKFLDIFFRALEKF